MTISTTASSISYSGNGVTTAFAVSFPFFASDELEVIERITSTGAETTKALTTDYTVTGGDGSTGTVTMLTAPASGRTLTIRRNTDRTQETDYPENDPFPAASHERALDRLTAIVQEVERDQTGRALLVAKTDGAVGVLPNSVDRGGKYLGFDSSGNPIAVAAAVGSTVVSTYAATLLDDANAAAARATLGSAATGDALFLAATAAAARAILGLASSAIVEQPSVMSTDANVLVNGGNEIWQASTALAISASTTATASIYAADQWCMETGANQACTISRQAGLSVTSAYCARVQRNSGQTGTGVLRYQTPLEIGQILRIRGQTVTAAALLRAGANLSGTLRIKLLVGTGSEGRRTNGASYTSETTPLDAALTLTTTTAEYSATSSVVVPAATTQATLCIEWTPSGTAGASDYFEIDDVRLQLGSVATPYVQRAPDDELARCQRFFWKITRAFNLSFNGTAGSQGFYAQVWFPVTMRGTPSVSSATSGGVNVLSTSITNITQDGFEVQGLTNAAGVAGFVYNNNNTADARL